MSPVVGKDAQQMASYSEVPGRYAHMFPTQMWSTFRFGRRPKNLNFESSVALKVEKGAGYDEKAASPDR